MCKLMSTKKFKLLPEAWEPSITIIKAMRIKVFMFYPSDTKRSFGRQFQKMSMKNII